MNEKKINLSEIPSKDSIVPRKDSIVPRKEHPDMFANLAMVDDLSDRTKNLPINRPYKHKIVERNGKKVKVKLPKKPVDPVKAERKEKRELEWFSKVWDINTSTMMERNNYAPVCAMNTLNVYPYQKPRDNTPQISRSVHGLKTTLRGYPNEEGVFEYPTGPYPRLVQLHAFRELIMNRNRVVELSSTRSEFLACLGLNKGGKQVVRMDRALEMMGKCPIMLERWDENTQKIRHLSFDIDLQWNKKNKGKDGQPELFKSYIKVSEDLYDEIINNKYFVDLGVIGNLIGTNQRPSGLEIDLYTWLVQRNFTLHKDNAPDVELGMQLMFEQFGTEGTTEKNFNENFWKAIKKVQVACPHIKVDRIKGRRGGYAKIRIRKSQKLIDHHELNYKKIVELSQPIEAKATVLED